MVDYVCIFSYGHVGLFRGEEGKGEGGREVFKVRFLQEIV